MCWLTLAHVLLLAAGMRIDENADMVLHADMQHAQQTCNTRTPTHPPSLTLVAPSSLTSVSLSSLLDAGAGDARRKRSAGRDADSGGEERDVEGRLGAGGRVHGLCFQVQSRSAPP